ncbi:hypothetical protein OE88DRAFT_1666674 [Heliocybe sulcata]|uniref:DUF6533 domain-containing protein n=1 Tax=Heliocybe sulcata TaxID=5364 RepID=A0A5C3MNM8_9AGAM|nr:hypothetical protein OE88DRAFT_1666674 [Heliocybe sulcata]
MPSSSGHTLHSALFDFPSMSRDNPEGQLVHEYVQFLSDMNMVKLFTVASAMWLAYDNILTLPREISHVWRAKWTIHRVLYIFLRIVALISMVFYLLVGLSTRLPAQVRAFCFGWDKYST